MPYSNMTFNVSTGLAFVVNDFVQVSYDANNYIIGRVVSYDSGTGVLVITPYDYKGSGSYSSWTVSLTGYNGTAATSGTSSISATAGTAGTAGTSATVGTSGESDSSGTSGTAATSGTSASAGSSGTGGSSGTAGDSAQSGTTGTSGTSGSSGTSAESGTSGSSGTNGSSATTGASGGSGTSGSSGSSASSGVSGTSGSSGVNGPTGSTGPTGTQGPTGSTGSSGVSGVNGPTGATGPQGPQGLTGFQGPTGPIGATGGPGPQGPTGPQGAQGPQGPSNSNNQSLNASNNAVFEGGVTTSQWYTAQRFYQGGHRGMISPSTPTFFGEGFGWYTFASIGSTYFFTVSTEEVKTNIEPFTASAMNLIDSTEIVTYKYELDGQDDTTRIGFIAEDTPEELATSKHDRIDINSSLGVMIKALQELDAKLAEKEKLYI
jgi:hypothetical protein